jgi:PAS domain S-box-containing protein
MESTLTEKLQSLSRNEDSFNELKQLFNELNEEKNRFQTYLQLLERVTEDGYDAILITDMNLEEPGPEIVYVNNGFTEITGYTADEVIGKTPRILQGPKSDHAVLERLKERLKSGRSFFGQTVNYRKDGSEFINQWDVHPLTNERGELTHWVSYQHDITERKRAEQRIINTHAEFDELRERSKSTLLDVNTEGGIITANKSFRELTGYAKDELKGKRVWELFPRKYRNSLKTRFDKAFEAADFNNQKLKGIVKHKKGLPIQVEGITSVLALKEGTIIRTEIKNISLQKQIMETLEKRKENYDKIVDQATEYNYRIALQGEELTVEYISEAFPRVTGLSVEEITGSSELEKFVHPDDAGELRNCLKQAMEGKPCTCEYRIRTINGRYEKVIDYCKPGTCKKDGEEQCVRGAVNFLPEEQAE